MAYAARCPGRVLTVRGPEGVTLGVERDPVGRPKWFRFPDGTMLRRSTTPTRTEDLLVGPSGQAMGTGAVTRTVDGAVRERIGPDGFVWRYDRNGAGDLLSISAEPDQMWSFDPGRVLTPDGRLQLYSVDEWLMESQLADGPAAWGLATGIVSMIRSDSGRLEAVTGDAGVSPVRFDALGRMVSFRAPDGVGWSVRYDARGRPTAVNGRDVDALWLWAPDGDPAGGVSGLLASGVEAAVPWVFSEGGMAVRRNAMNIEGIVADGRGDPAWMLDGEGGVAVLSHSPSGLPRQMATDIVGAGGRLQWFPGGPIQVGPVAIDPVSGQRADGVKAWPWAPKGPREVALNHPADPAPWAPVSVWGKPLRILEAMGVLKPVTDGDWVELNAPPTAHSSPPASLDRSDVPLGPCPRVGSDDRDRSGDLGGHPGVSSRTGCGGSLLAGRCAHRGRAGPPMATARMGGAGAGDLARCGSVGSRLNNRPWQTCHLASRSIESGPPYGGCSSVG